MDKLLPREVLDKKMHHHSRWYWANRLFRDYSQAISLVISVSIPTCLLVIPSLPPDQQKFLNTSLLIVTLIGLLLSLLRAIFRFEEKTIHNGKLLRQIREIALNYDNELIDDKALVAKLVEIEIEEQKEIER